MLSQYGDIVGMTGANEATVCCENKISYSVVSTFKSISHNLFILISNVA